MKYNVQYEVHYRKKSHLMGAVQQDFIPQIGSRIGFQYWEAEVFWVVTYPFSGRDRPMHVDVHILADSESEYLSIAGL